ncbi:uncharacterized protein LOC144124666 isoform X2 [Amblyomma americanum]
MKPETKACREDELVGRMEDLYRQVSAELCNDPELKLLKSFGVEGDCSPLEVIRQCADQTLQTFYSTRNESSACRTLELGLVRCLSDPSSMCRQPIQREPLAKRSVAAFMSWHGCQGPPPASTTPRPVDPFLEECPFQLHELCLVQGLDVARAMLLLYGQPGRNLSHFYAETCGEPPEPCRPEDSLDKCTLEQRATLQRFHLAAVAAQGTLCDAPPQLLANLTAAHSCWDEKAFRECAVGDASKPLGRHLLGSARTDEECRLLRSGWSGCLERSFVRRCEETPDVEGARGLLLNFLDRLQPCGESRLRL